MVVSTYSEDSFGSNTEQDLLMCGNVNNVTIVAYDIADIDDIIPQLNYLVKSLLDHPCTIVSIYSPLQTRSILQTKDGSIQLKQNFKR